MIVKYTTQNTANNMLSGIEYDTPTWHTTEQQEVYNKDIIAMVKITFEIGTQIRRGMEETFRKNVSYTILETKTYKKGNLV